LIYFFGFICFGIFEQQMKDWWAAASITVSMINR
jgi:hypothetical protein